MSFSLFSNDTIAAIATPLGRGGIGIIRLSGSEATVIGQKIIRGAFPLPRHAAYRDFLDEQGEVLDQGIVIYFPRPHSFTGEDTIEFQGHGSPQVLNSLLKNLIVKGARLARPGEFSERAFLNNRLDLAQAEAIADLIEASSAKAARAAMRSLQGVFSKKVHHIDQSLIKLRTFIEAAIDFSEEAIETLSKTEIELKILGLLKEVQQLQKEAKQGQQLQAGMQLVLVGPPNAGKSSLLNALSGEDTAIISAAPGTTRDLLTAEIVIDGLPVHLVDTAGLHETKDGVEREGIRRALAALEKADQVLWVVDSNCKESEAVPHEVLKHFNVQMIKVPIAIVRNKIDLSHEPLGLTKGKVYDTLRLSATTLAGLTELKIYLKNRMNYESDASHFSARERHINALRESEKALQKGVETWCEVETLELLAVQIHEAHQAIGEITGVFTTEDLLGHIFSTFCIGK